LQFGINIPANIKKSVNIFNDLLDRIKGNQKQLIFDILSDNHLLKSETATKEKVIELFKK
jgi:hypothetical protein